MTRDGFIDVTLDGTTPEYTARCGCGWSGVEETAVEWADVAMVGHLASHLEGMKTRVEWIEARA